MSKSCPASGSCYVLTDTSGRHFCGRLTTESGQRLDDGGWTDDPARAWEFPTRADAEAARTDAIQTVMERRYDD